MKIRMPTEFETSNLLAYRVEQPLPQKMPIVHAIGTRANAESIDEAFRQIVLNARRAEAEDKRTKSSEAAR